MSMRLRIAVITLGLAAAGLVGGGVVGMVMMACWLVIGGATALLREPEVFIYGGLFGGVVGAVLGPLAAWLLMRHVPLGLAIGGTAAGTLAGAVLGLAAGDLNGSLLGALLGFGASAVFLRLRKPRGIRAIAAPDGGGIARLR